MFLENIQHTQNQPSPIIILPVHRWVQRRFKKPVRHYVPGCIVLNGEVRCLGGIPDAETDAVSKAPVSDPGVSDFAAQVSG